MAQWVDYEKCVGYNITLCMQVLCILLMWNLLYKEGLQMEKKNILTVEGLKTLQDELNELKVTRRAEIAQKIKEAREQGDLSENAEYDAAKDEQRDIELRIEEIEKILKNAEVYDDGEDSADTISIGTTVTILDKEFKEEMVFKIVGSTEADSLRGKISNESPVGKALLGKKKGQTVKVETEAGILEYKILAMEKPAKDDASAKAPAKKAKK